MSLASVLICASFDSVDFRRAKKPLQPKATIQVATETAVPTPIPIMAAVVVSDGSQAIVIAHGTALKPTLEKIVRC